MDNAAPRQTTEEDFIQAYENYADAIFRHCAYRVFDREAGKDLMQETFMRAWDYIAKGNTVGHMRGFLYKIANNLIINAAKKKKTESLEKLAEAGFEPSNDDGSSMATRFDASIVVATLKQLDPETRTLLTMRFIDELGPQEIADILGLSANVVSVRLHRAVKELRSLLHND